MTSRRLFAWLFALCLLFGQAAAFAHALTHLRAHDQALPDHVCEVCVAQANLGSAAPAAVFVLPADPFRFAESLAVGPSLVSACPGSALARAPPPAI